MLSHSLHFQRRHTVTATVGNGGTRDEGRGEMRYTRDPHANIRDMGPPPTRARVPHKSRIIILAWWTRIKLTLDFHERPTRKTLALSRPGLHLPSSALSAVPSSLAHPPGLLHLPLVDLARLRRPFALFCGTRASLALNLPLQAAAISLKRKSYVSSAFSSTTGRQRPFCIPRRFLFLSPTCSRRQKHDLRGLTLIVSRERLSAIVFVTGTRRVVSLLIDNLFFRCRSHMTK